MHLALDVMHLALDVMHLALEHVNVIWHDRSVSLWDV